MLEGSAAGSAETGAAAGEQPAPGWYPDARRGGLRWWDGSAWTSHRRTNDGIPMDASTPATTPGASTPATTGAAPAVSAGAVPAASVAVDPVQAQSAAATASANSVLTDINWPDAPVRLNTESSTGPTPVTGPPTIVLRERTGSSRLQTAAQTVGWPMALVIAGAVMTLLSLPGQWIRGGASAYNAFARDLPWALSGGSHEIADGVIVASSTGTLAHGWLLVALVIMAGACLAVWGRLWGAVVLVVTSLGGTLLVLLDLFALPSGLQGLSTGLGLGWGAFLALVGLIGMLVGALLHLRSVLEVERATPFGPST